MKKKKFHNVLRKMINAKPTRKSKLREQHLAVQLNIPQGTQLLNQRSAFFNKEYEKEKSLLSWN